MFNFLYQFLWCTLVPVNYWERLDRRSVMCLHCFSLPCLWLTSSVMLTKAKWKSLISESNWSSSSSVGGWQQTQLSVELHWKCPVFFFSFCFVLFSLNGNVKLLPDKRSSKLSPSTDKLFKRQNWHRNKFWEAESSWKTDDVLFLQIK